MRKTICKPVATACAKTELSSVIDDAHNRAMKLAFDHTFRNYNPDFMELSAFDKLPKSTRMSKDTIAARIQGHTDKIKRRQERIKILTMLQKQAKDPDKVRRIAYRITQHKERLGYNKAAIDYYKKLSRLPQPGKNKAKVKPIKPIKK